MLSDFASWAPARPRFWPPRLAVWGAQNNKILLETLMKQQFGSRMASSWPARPWTAGCEKKRYVVTRPAGHAKKERYVVRVWETLRKKKDMLSDSHVRRPDSDNMYFYLAENICS